MIIVTSRNGPDLDGIACVIGYAEVLNNLGKRAKATYYGDLSLEVDFVKNFTNFFPLEKHEGEYSADDKFVLMDTADPDALEPSIHPKNVMEIFDHRQLVFLEKFVNSQNKIEQVGSCATLISEEIMKNGLVPSKNAAIYLYSAIISNTINFMNSVTTPRDIAAANWLKSLVDLPGDYVKQMFSAKSIITEGNLYQIIDQDFAIKMVAGKRIGIAQIEIVDLVQTYNKFKEQVSSVLKTLKQENSLDYVLFSGIDIIEGGNLFYTFDLESNKLFTKVLGIPEINSGEKTRTITMRKQIWPKLEAALRSNT